MGVDLFGKKGGYVSFNWHAWGDLLSLAQHHGWEPAGTILNEQAVEDLHVGVPEGRCDYSEVFERITAEDAVQPASVAEGIPRQVWDGGYCSNDFQFVTTADAAQLGAALKRALLATPAAQVTDEYDGIIQQLEMPTTDDLSFDPSLAPSFEPDFDPAREYRDRIEEFIKFCERGGFAIG